MEDYTRQFQGALRTLDGTGKLNFSSFISPLVGSLPSYDLELSYS